MPPCWQNLSGNTIPSCCQVAKMKECLWQLSSDCQVVILYYQELIRPYWCVAILLPRSYICWHNAAREQYVAKLPGAAASISGSSWDERNSIVCYETIFQRGAHLNIKIFLTPQVGCGDSMVAPRLRIGRHGFESSGISLTCRKILVPCNWEKPTELAWI